MHGTVNVKFTVGLVVLSWSSIAAVTRNGQCFDCATVAFSERYSHFDTPVSRSVGCIAACTPL